jgi:hypothetical protein
LSSFSERGKDEEGKIWTISLLCRFSVADDEMLMLEIIYNTGLCIIVRIIEAILLYALYKTLGFWITLGIFLFVTILFRKWDKEAKEKVKYNIANGIDSTPKKIAGFSATDFLLGWVFSRLFK